ncbi:PfkB family carbohydrate kinase [Streptomyces sp. NPDC004542]|uniref:carbohydrate kinase family protein n=1 Tax=Streptomyces sp. NPDC004542 TaxID=3154281 RepID=UPI0033BF804D
MTRSLLAVFSHVVTDEVYDPDGRFRARAVGGAGAYAAVGASLVTGPGHAVLVSGAGRADLPRLTGWCRDHGVDPSGLFEVGEHSPVTQVRYRPDGERSETSVYGDEHFAAHTPYPSCFPLPDDRIACAYLFHDTEERFWTELAEARPRLRGPVLWEIAANACRPELRSSVLELAAGVDVLSLNAAEATALTGLADPLAALGRLHHAAGVTVLRCGAAGSVVQEAGRRWRVGVAPGPVTDPTGGGNAYSGAFLAAWARTGDAAAAGRAAASAAAHTIARYGTPAADPVARSAVRRAADHVTVSPIP